MFLIFPLLLTLSLSHAAFTHESEVSTLSTGGNTEVETYLIKTTNLIQKNIRSYRFGGHYTYGEAGNNVNARDWDANAKYEQMVTPHFAITTGELIEGYKFQGIKARYNSDLALRYYFIKTDLKQFFSELGYRYTIEDRYLDEENQCENKIRLYTEYTEKISETVQYRVWAEYIPNLTEREDYLFTFEASLTSILTSIFSLKVAYRGTYDEVPAIEGNKNYDYTYTTSLIAKF